MGVVMDGKLGKVGDRGVRTVVALGLAGTFEDSHVGVMLVWIARVLSEDTEYDDG